MCTVSAIRNGHRQQAKKDTRSPLHSFAIGRRSMRTVAYRRSGWQATFLLAAACVLSSCSQVVETSAIGYAAESHADSPFGCRGRLGTYNLPKTYLRIQIARVGTSPPEYVLHTISEVVKPDNERVFCLDYLASSFSNDQVKVRKSKDAGGSTGHPVHVSAKIQSWST